MRISVVIPAFNNYPLTDRCVAVKADTPCGEVVFNVRGTPEYHDGAASERVTATAQFPDGHTETDTFPYRWTYAEGERDDPWLSTNLAKPNFDIPLVFPPPGTDPASFSPLIKHSRSHAAQWGDHARVVSEPDPAPRARLTGSAPLR